MMRDLFGDDQQLVAGSLRGYRCWQTVDQAGGLRSVGVNYTWRVRAHENAETASCRGGTCGGPSPGEKCTCGIYGWYDPADHRLASSSIFGVVAAHGRIQLGTHGFRAERAKVLAVTSNFGYLRALLEEHGFQVFDTVEDLVAAYPPDDVSGIVKHRCKTSECATNTHSYSSMTVTVRAMAARRLAELRAAAAASASAAALVSPSAMLSVARAVIDVAKDPPPKPKP